MKKYFIMIFVFVLGLMNVGFGGSVVLTSFQQLAGTGYTQTRGIQSAIGDNLMIQTASGIESVGLDGSKWYVGFLDQDGYVVGWAENVYPGVSGKEGWLKGKYTNEIMTYDDDHKPNGVIVVNDLNGDGLGIWDTGLSQWFIGDDDTIYREGDILFGPDKIRGAVDLLPAYDDGNLYLPEMVIAALSPSVVFPAQSAVDVELDVVLEWSVSPGMTFTHDVYFGTDPEQLALLSAGQTETTYTLEPLTWGQKYYWRIDERDGETVLTGATWSFTTGIPVTGIPGNNATGVDVNIDLAWQMNTQRAFTHDIYFGTNPQGLTLLGQGLSAVELALDKLNWATVYYWRIDERDGTKVYPGQLWSFKTIVPTCPTPQPGDVNNDCRVNIEDLAIIAGNWLSCSLIPAEACQ